MRRLLRPIRSGAGNASNASRTGADNHAAAPIAMSGSTNITPTMGTGVAVDAYMPVLASAIASPIHSPAIVTVVSFCTGDSGIMVTKAFRFTAIAAVKTIVPIRSSIVLSF